MEKKPRRSLLWWWHVLVVGFAIAWGVVIYFAIRFVLDHS